MTNSNCQTLEVDVCGQICPSTLLTALRQINQHKTALRSGELELKILTDNHDSTNRICEAVDNMGYLITVEDLQGHFKISIAKKNGNRKL